MKNVVCLILGGGKGTRLLPLTADRSKPAVPLAGKYRLIDIPISNCISSGIRRIYVLTQFNSVSLHRHIRQSYNFDSFSGASSKSSPPSRPTRRWTGTRNGRRRPQAAPLHLGMRDRLRHDPLRDQLYRMDFQEMLNTHLTAGADVTIAGLPVETKRERPASALSASTRPDAWRGSSRSRKRNRSSSWSGPIRPGSRSRGSTAQAGIRRQHGIYLFNRDTLVELLTKTDYHDFGKEVFPMSIRTRHVQLHMFDGYWEDIGTIGKFYQANLDLTDPNPPFSDGRRRHADLPRPAVPAAVA